MKSNRESIKISLWCLHYFALIVNCDLVVNVRNQGGESYKQTIRANLTDETVTLKYASHDGSSTIMVIDFRNEIQLVHVSRLGDQEENDLVYHSTSVDTDNNIATHKRRVSKNGVVNEPTAPAVYKSYCFVTKFKANEFIPVDAMAKLRQKNPMSKRTYERQEPPQNISFDILLDVRYTDWISPTIREHCVSEPTYSITTYAIKMEISEKAVNPEDYLRSVRDITVIDDKPCESSVGVRGGAGACVCSDTVCIGWYPCALKYCRTRGTVNGTLGGGGGGGAAAAGGGGGGGSSTPDSNFKTYRCGIHTCRICRSYFFGVRGASDCV